MVFAKALGCLLFSLAVAGQVKADQLFEISGSLTIPGNSSNPGVSENISFCFELNYSQTLGNAGVIPALVGPPNVTASGPLGTFYLAQNDGFLGSPVGSGYVGFFNNPNPDSSTVEIDLIGYFTPALAPVPQVLESDLYSCLAPEPCSEFQPSTSVSSSGPGLYWPGTASATVSSVSAPEPGIPELLALGTLSLGLLKRRTRI